MSADGSRELVSRSENYRRRLSSVTLRRPTKSTHCKHDGRTYCSARSQRRRAEKDEASAPAALPSAFQTALNLHKDANTSLSWTSRLHAMSRSPKFVTKTRQRFRCAVNDPGSDFSFYNACCRSHGRREADADVAVGMKSLPTDSDAQRLHVVREIESSSASRSVRGNGAAATHGYQSSDFGTRVQTPR